MISTIIRLEGVGSVAGLWRAARVSTPHLTPPAGNCNWRRSRGPSYFSYSFSCFYSFFSCFYSYLPVSTTTSAFSSSPIINYFFFFSPFSTHFPLLHHQQLWLVRIRCPPPFLNRLKSGRAKKCVDDTGAREKIWVSGPLIASGCSPCVPSPLHCFKIQIFTAFSI